jgi:hypothetical protein
MDGQDDYPGHRACFTVFYGFIVPFEDVMERSPVQKKKIVIRTKEDTNHGIVLAIIIINEMLNQKQCNLLRDEVDLDDRQN